MPLEILHCAARLPAQDLERARAWYVAKLDLHPVEERPGGLRYLAGGSTDASSTGSRASQQAFSRCSSAASSAGITQGTPISASASATPCVPSTSTER